jgi:hypothetical protein
LDFSTWTSTNFELLAVIAPSLQEIQNVGVAKLLERAGTGPRVPAVGIVFLTT